MFLDRLSVAANQSGRSPLWIQTFTPMARGWAITGVLRERGADPGGDDTALRVACVGHRVAHEMHPAALPGRVQHLGDGRLQAIMGVGDDQLHAPQAAVAQTAQKLRSERLGFAVPGGHAEHLAAAVGVDAHRDNDGNRDDALVTPGANIGRIEPQIRLLALNRPVQEGLHPFVDVLAEPRDLALADPLHAHGPDQVVHRAGGDALDVGFSWITAVRAFSEVRRG